MTDLHITFTITGISQISTLNTATPPQNNPPTPPALSLILLQRPAQDVNLPTSPQSIWFDVLVSTWFRLGESPQSKDEEREKDGQNSKFFYHLLFNTIQLCQTCVFGSSYRDPAAHLAHHWRSRRSCSKIECPPSLREVPGKNGMDFQRCYENIAEEQIKARLFRWSPRHEPIASCKTQCVLMQKITGYMHSESFKSLQVNIRIPVRGLSHLLAVLFGAARLPVLLFRQLTSWLDTSRGTMVGRWNTLLKDV